MNFGERHYMRHATKWLFLCSTSKTFYIRFRRSCVGSDGAEFGYSRRGREARRKPAQAGCRRYSTRRFRAVTGHVRTFTVSKGIAFEKLCPFPSSTLSRKHYYVIDCSKSTGQLYQNIFFSAATSRTFYCSKAE